MLQEGYGSVASLVATFVRTVLLYGTAPMPVAPPHVSYPSCAELVLVGNGLLVLVGSGPLVEVAVAAAAGVLVKVGTGVLVSVRSGVLVNVAAAADVGVAVALTGVDPAAGWKLR